MNTTPLIAGSICVMCALAHAQPLPSPEEQPGAQPSAPSEPRGGGAATGPAPDASPRQEIPSEPRRPTTSAPADSPSPTSAPTAPVPPEVSGGESKSPAQRAVFLHAQALNAELDGDFLGALETLRSAQNLDPTNDLIAFDLARLALLRGGTDDDLEPFWRSPLRSPSADRLRNVVATRLGRQPSTATHPIDTPWLSARLRTGVEIDSNVNLAADDSSPGPTAELFPGAGQSVLTAPESLLGVRWNLDGELFYRPLRDELALELGAVFRLGRYLNDTDQLQRFMANTLMGVASFQWRPSFMVLTANIVGTHTLRGGEERYLSSVNGRLDARFNLGGGHLGAYGIVGYRDFEHPALEGGVYDRDHSQYGAGIVWDAGGRTIVLGGNIGWWQEAADGDAQDTHNADVSLYMNMNFDVVQATVGASGLGRLYHIDFAGLQAITNLRVDVRTSPYARVSVPILPWLAVYGWYAFTHNWSTWDGQGDEGGNFNYLRHLAQVGVEGRL